MDLCSMKDERERETVSGQADNVTCTVQKQVRVNEGVTSPAEHS